MSYRKKDVDPLDQEKSRSMNIAKQLGYGAVVQDRIASAKSIPEIYRILKQARMAE